MMFHVKHTQPEWPLDADRRLHDFAAILLRWNERINLISRADHDRLWQRHIHDSAQLASLLPPDCRRLIDLGSGAGFPGLVLAIVTGCHAELIEADQRKAAFLREAVRATHTSATVHSCRVEAAQIEPARAITARALAPLPVLLELAEPLLESGGYCLFPKGASVDDELTSSTNRWHMHVERFASQTNPGATILRLSEIRRAGPRS